MTTGTGTSTKGRQIITNLGSTLPIHIWLSLNPPENITTRYRGVIILETFNPATGVSQEYDVKQLWHGGVRWRSTAQFNFAPAFQLRLVANWQEAGIPFQWFFNN